MNRLLFSQFARHKFSLFSVVLFLNISSFSAQTSESITLENGVIIHQSKGVEIVESKRTAEIEKRDINNWSLEECIWAIDIIESKLNAEFSEDRIVYYNEQLKAVRMRIQFLKQNK